MITNYDQWKLAAPDYDVAEIDFDDLSEKLAAKMCPLGIATVEHFNSVNGRDIFDIGNEMLEKGHKSDYYDAVAQDDEGLPFMRITREDAADLIRAWLDANPDAAEGMYCAVVA